MRTSGCGDPWAQGMLTARQRSRDMFEFCDFIRHVWGIGTDRLCTSSGIPASSGSKVAAASRRPSAMPCRSVGGSMHTGDMLRRA